MALLTQGERFKDARTVYNQHSKQTMAEVSAATNVSSSLISDIECDKDRKVNYVDMVKLAKHYGVSLDWLCGLTDVRTLDISVKAIAKETGLTEDSVLLLQILKHGGYLPPFEHNESSLRFINDLLESMYAGSSDSIGANYGSFLHSAQKKLMCTEEFEPNEEELKAMQLLEDKGVLTVDPEFAPDFLLNETANMVRRSLELMGIENLKKRIGFIEEGK